MALVIAALVTQVAALIFGGHTTYLWVQGSEAILASPILAAYAMSDLRPNLQPKWPPLLPLAAIALAGGIKDLQVASGAHTSPWVVVALLAAVAWFLIASIVCWRRRPGRRLTPGTEV